MGLVPAWQPIPFFRIAFRPMESKKFSAGPLVLLDQIVDPLVMWDDALQGAITGISV
jgi:hypothetical protein